MKALPFNIPKPNNDAIVFQIDKQKRFYDKFHQHEELQISFIQNGEGTLLIGDNFTDYKSGNIIVIGSHIPHAFKSSNSNSVSLMKSVFFKSDSFGAGFFKRDNFSILKPFFRQASQGFKIEDPNPNIKDKFSALEHANPFKSVVILLELLEQLSVDNQLLLTSNQPLTIHSDTDGQNLRSVIDYTLKNYKSAIKIDDVAGTIHLSKTAFCKYFKKRTRKTYIQYLNELRIAEACKLLKSNLELTVADIAYKTGFNNISNFNRRFKVEKKLSPLAYRKHHKPIRG